MSKNIETIDDLFRLAGGSVQLAAGLKMNQYTIDRWAKTGIPIDHWSFIEQKYKLSVDTIYKISERARKSYKARVNGDER